MNIKLTLTICEVISTFLVAEITFNPSSDVSSICCDAQRDRNIVNNSKTNINLKNVN